MLTQRTAPTALVALIGLVILAPSAHADHQWGNRYWADPTPIRVVDYGAHRAANPTFWRQTRDAALAEWERSGVVRFRVRERRGVGCQGFARSAIGLIRRAFPDGGISLCKWRDPERPLIAGWASAPPQSNGAIREAVVAVRAPQSLCHEVGHALGLDHPADDPDSCLDYGDWRYPSTRDLEMLRLIYG